MKSKSAMGLHLAGTVAGLVVLASLVSGCDKTRAAFGLEKSPPDEFAVVTRAPLQIPPDFGLRPPTPGMARPQELTVRDEARRFLVESNGDAARQKAPQGLSPGETAILKRAGAEDADPSIRQVVSRENSILEPDDSSFVDRMMFWREPEPKGQIVDPTKESQRLRENAALGEPPTKGATPVIVRKEKGWFEGIFN